MSQNLHNKMIFADAFDEAVDYCIKSDILYNILEKNRSEVMNSILTEYNEQLHIDTEKEISKNEGLTEGKIEGTIETLQELDIPKEDILNKVIEKFSVSKEDAEKYLNQYWK